MTNSQHRGTRTTTSDSRRTTPATERNAAVRRGTPHHQRALAAIGCALALTLGMSGTATASTATASTTTAQAETADPNWWYSALKIPEAQAEGLTGKGVKIAIMDGFINPDAPLLAGADLTVDPYTACDQPSTATDQRAFHGTGMASLILARPTGNEPMSGIAPDASVTFYSIGDPQTRCDGYQNQGTTHNHGTLGAQIERAINDGARIISISAIVSNWTSADNELIARAIAEGIIVVTASINGQLDDDGYPNMLNGVVSVTATDASGALQIDSGNSVKGDEVTVAAPGVDIRVPGRSEDPVDWNSTSVMSGTSIATPLVAGSLALAIEKYPDATGNQVIQALTMTTRAAQEGYGYSEADGYGYGTISLPKLLSTDPTRFADENPLMNRVIGRPSVEQVEKYKTESSPSPTAAPVAPASPTPSASSTASSIEEASPVLPIAIGGGVLIVLAATTIIIVTAQRRRSRSTQPN